MIAHASSHFPASGNAADERVSGDSETFDVQSCLPGVTIGDETTQLFLTTSTTREYKIKIYRFSDDQLRNSTHLCLRINIRTINNDREYEKDE